jgi:gliding motility-associated-like protein
LRKLYFLLSFVLAASLSNAQNLCTGSLGDPIVNITFGSGSGYASSLPTIVPGASTTYSFTPTSGVPVSPIVYDGSYTICNGIPNNTPWFSNAPDHTPGDVNGYMAFFNASSSASEFYSQTISNLCPNTRYEFAAWIANALNPAIIAGQKPNITFQILQTNGTLLGSIASGDIAQNNSLVWQQYGFFFSTPAGVNTVVLKMINSNPGGANFPGNDLAIDDITLRACGPSLNASFASSSNVDLKLQCGLDPIQLYGISSNQYTAPAYLWQVSTNAGLTWNDIPGATSLSVVYTPTSYAVHHFRLVSSESSNINSPTCRVASQMIKFITYEIPQGGIETIGNSCTGTTSQMLFTSNMSGPLSIYYTDGTTTFSYLGIQSGSTFQPNPLPSVTTTYTLVSINTGNGCSRTSGFTRPTAVLSVGAPPPVTVSGDPKICQGDSAQLQATGGISYSWSPTAGLNNPNIPSPKASPSSTTLYKVVATSVGGCKDSAYFTVTVKPKPVIGLSPGGGTYCPGTPFIISALAQPGNSYLWHPATGLSSTISPTVAATPAATTTYWVVVSDANGCKDSLPATVVAGTTPIATASISGQICAGDSAQLFATGGTAYVWSGPGLSNNLLPNPKAAPLTTTTYSVEVINNFNCRSLATVTLPVNSKPVISVLPSSAAICAGDSLQLVASGGGTYAWSPASGLSSGVIANPKAAPALSTIYWATVTAANGCKDSASASITVNPKPLITHTPGSAICRGDSLQLLAAGGSTYLWSPATGLSNASISNPKASPASGTTYQVLVATAAGCKDSANMTLTVNAKPTVIVSPATDLCRGDSVQLSASGGNSYQWQPATSLSNPLIGNPFAFPRDTTRYTVIVSNAAGCIDSASTQVNVFRLPLVFQHRDTVLCGGSSFITDASMLPGSTGWLWSDGSTSPTFSIGAPGDYWVQTQVTGCRNPVRDSIHVDSLGLPTVSLGPDSTICSYDIFFLGFRGNNIRSYVWNNGSTDSSIRIVSSDTYGIMVSNACGTAQDLVDINVESCNDDIYFPDAFTPDGDRRNDKYRAAHLPGVTVFTYELYIYNRWGELVFFTTKLDAGWDGTLKGKMQDTGTFVWMARYRKRSGESEQFRKGTFLLIR